MNKQKDFFRPRFTATFEISEDGFSFTGSLAGSHGACGESIAKVDNAFKPLYDLHLCDSKGRPMHYLENAFYVFRDSKYDIERLFGYWNLESKDFPEMTKEINAFVSGMKKTIEGMEGKTLAEVEAIHEELNDRLKALIEDRIESNLFPIWQKRADSIEKILESIPERLEGENEPFNPEDYLPKELALAQFLDCSPDDIETSSYDDNSLSGEGSDYLVLTEDEADDLWEESLENYIEECILPDLPETAQMYFDYESWKRDARFDGRGHSLASYDGEEHEETIENETFYIYKN